MRRWVKAAVSAAVCVGLGGWFAKPYAQDWWLAHDACDGVVPSRLVRQLIPEDAHLTGQEAMQVDGLGSYTCELTLEGSGFGHGRLLKATAFTQRDDQDREFSSVFPNSGFSPQAPLPGELPGFLDDVGNVRLMLPCPELGKDAAGRQRKLLVGLQLRWEAHREAPPGAVHEAAVTLANSASEKLGCGAEPLEVPQTDRLPSDVSEADGPKTVPLAKVKGTPCSWLARAGLPTEQKWRVAVRSNGHGPTGRCDVMVGGEGADGQEPELTFLAWYGDWSSRLVSWEGQPRSLTATARCRGEAANYAMSADEDLSGLGRTARQSLLKAFARDEVHRRGCAGLRFTL